MFVHLVLTLIGLWPTPQANDVDCSIDAFWNKIADVRQVVEKEYRSTMDSDTWEIIDNGFYGDLMKVIVNKMIVLSREMKSPVSEAHIRHMKSQRGEALE